VTEKQPPPQLPSGVYALADGFECALRVEITSDAPEKVADFRAKLVELILESNAEDDVMVTVHDAGVNTTTE
jgi:hypothetical protein